MEYAVAEWRHKYRIASENPAKEDMVAGCSSSIRQPRPHHRPVSEAAARLRKRFDMPLIMGQTPTAEREDLYNKFRHGEIRQLILSKVGNFAIDLPDANVLIQVSGTFRFAAGRSAAARARSCGPSRSGEVAHFYTLVTRDTRELDFAHHRQLFLTEQGYSYRSRTARN